MIANQEALIDAVVPENVLNAAVEVGGEIATDISQAGAAVLSGSSQDFVAEMADSPNGIGNQLTIESESLLTTASVLTSIPILDRIARSSRGRNDDSNASDETSTVISDGQIDSIGVDTNNVNTASTLNIDNTPPSRISDDVIDLPERINLEDTVAHTAVPMLDNSFVNRTNQSVIINDFDNLDLSGAPGRILVGTAVVGVVAAGEGLAQGIRESRDAAQNIYDNQNKEDQANASIPKK